MNIYDLSRNFWNYAFDNPEKIKPVHTAMYFYAIEHCNRLGWKEKFGLPTTIAMEAIGVKSYNTFIKTLNELVEFGFLTIHQRSRNQYTSNIIALSKNDKAQYKALDEAIIKHGTKQDESAIQSTGESIDSIDRQSYNLTNTQTHTHSQMRKRENSGEGFSGSPEDEAPQSPGCARPPFPGYPVSDDVPTPPATTLEHIAARQYQTGKGLVTADQVLETWKSWLPLNVTGEKFYNNVNDIYRHFSNRCEQIRIANSEPAKRPSGGFQNGSAAGTARGRGASIEDLQKLKRHSAPHDSQRDDFAEVEIVE